MHTHVVYNHLPSPTCKHMWLSWHTVLINVDTNMKDTNQAGPDYRSWLGFNIQYEVQTQHHTHNRVSAMPARTSPYK